MNNVALTQHFSKTERSLVGRDEKANVYR